MGKGDCNRLNCVPLRNIGWVLTPRTSGVTLFGNGAFLEVIRLKQGPRVGPRPIGWVFLSKGDIGTQR